jgi:hypothetical protein
VRRLSITTTGEYGDNRQLEKLRIKISKYQKLKLVADSKAPNIAPTLPLGEIRSVWTQKLHAHQKNIIAL